jgi:hypothetical protein
MGLSYMSGSVPQCVAASSQGSPLRTRLHGIGKTHTRARALQFGESQHWAAGLVLFIPGSESSKKKVKQ